MTNWESEIKFYQLQQSQKEQDARSEESRKLQEDRIRQEKERGEMMTSMRIDYDSRIVPEFELLDKFFIRENLLEIKNQIWKIGEVSKNPLDFNDYFQKKGKPKIFHKDYCANYTLAVITIGYCPKSSIWAPYEGTTYYPEKIDISSESLSVSTDLTNIYINGKPGEITIPLTQDIEETKEIIHQTLIKDSSIRHDYSQIDPEIFQYPQLLQKFFQSKNDRLLPREIQEQLYHNKSSQKRSILDKLLGR